MSSRKKKHSSDGEHVQAPVLAAPGWPAAVRLDGTRRPDAWKLGSRNCA